MSETEFDGETLADLVNTDAEAEPVVPVVDDDFESIVLARLDRIEATQDGLREGVNTIGAMMNQVAEAFDQIMQKVNQGGIAGLLGGIMGGKKND